MKSAEESEAQLLEEQAARLEGATRAELVAWLTKLLGKQVELATDVARLTQLVKSLQERLSKNSSNSSKPPSSDSAADKRKMRNERKKREEKKKRKRGGQKGHKGSHRQLLDQSKVDDFVDLYPKECECGESLPEQFDPEHSRRQVTELPPITPHTTEYRRHCVSCPSCGTRTRAKDDPHAPRGAFGPRLSSILALMTGVYHLSRRRVQRAASDLFGVTISLGALSQLEGRVSTALKPLNEEAWAVAQDAPVKHTDGTSWLQSGLPLQLWTIASAAVTVFKVVIDGSSKTLRPLFGKIKGVLTSDRASALNFWAMKDRQICFAHLLRKFVSFAERDGPGAYAGRQLLEAMGIVFAHWHAFKDGKITRPQLQEKVGPLRQLMEALIEKAAAAGVKGLSGSCKNILKHREALWTFIDTPDVEPTNNHAEQELRGFVLWRKRSFGTQSTRGNEFAERIMTVAHTARKQERHVLTLLTETLKARLTQITPPSLFV